jgi:hypothetical protein
LSLKKRVQLETSERLLQPNSKDWPRAKPALIYTPAQNQRHGCPVVSAAIEQSPPFLEALLFGLSRMSPHKSNLSVGTRAWKHAYILGVY